MNRRVEFAITANEKMEKMLKLEVKTTKKYFKTRAVSLEAAFVPKFE
jgi:hypothetical protein